MPTTLGFYIKVQTVQDSRATNYRALESMKWWSFKNKLLHNEKICWYKHIDVQIDLCMTVVIYKTNASLAERHNTGAPS